MSAHFMQELIWVINHCIVRAKKLLKGNMVKGQELLTISYCAETYKIIYSKTSVIIEKNITLVITFRTLIIIIKNIKTFGHKVL